MEEPLLVCHSAAVAAVGVGNAAALSLWLMLQARIQLWLYEAKGGTEPLVRDSTLWIYGQCWKRPCYGAHCSLFISGPHSHWVPCPLEVMTSVSMCVYSLHGCIAVLYCSAVPSTHYPSSPSAPLPLPDLSGPASQPGEHPPAAAVRPHSLRCTCLQPL